MGKEIYKLKLPKKWKIHNIFHMLLLKQNTNKKKQVDKNVIEIEASGNKSEYMVEEIWNSAIYAKKSIVGHLPGFYYLIS